MVDLASSFESTISFLFPTVINFRNLLFLFSHQVVYDSFATPWTVAQQVPLSIGFPRQEYWSGLPFSSPRDLPDPGIELTFLALAGGFFITEPPGKSIQFSSVQSLSRVRHFATP